MSTTFKLKGSDQLVAIRCAGKMEWIKPEYRSTTHPLSYADSTQVVAIDNSPQGIYTIGDIREAIKTGDIYPKDTIPPETLEEKKARLEAELEAVDAELESTNKKLLKELSKLFIFIYPESDGYLEPTTLTEFNHTLILGEHYISVLSIVEAIKKGTLVLK